MTDFGTRLVAAFGGRAVSQDASLGPLTTFRVGGPADWLVDLRTHSDIVKALGLAREAGVPVTMMGGGSNVLVSDSGVRGLVIRARGGEISRISDTVVRADAGATVNSLVRWMVLHGAAGLEAWAGTPGTVGGAISGNAHFGGRLIGEHVAQVLLATREGVVSTVPASEMRFGYDRSRLKETGEILLSADFNVGSGNPSALRATARESLAFRKRTQPLDTPSAGCVFQNPARGRDVVPEGVPWSAGALIDRAGLKGVRIGGASVSRAHGNFIVSDSRGTASDIRRLIEHCRAVVFEKFGVRLLEEIVYLGEF